ncbi:hypothetical protein GCM10023235_53930 [Kitasatospora terrestris]|uniref:Uncharacterized protein n=1 Tax=Kitasatospora terrestris TaxID=258051 RepID=A0ABP9E792_9ACTN
MTTRPRAEHRPADRKVQNPSAKAQRNIGSDQESRSKSRVVRRRPSRSVTAPAASWARKPSQSEAEAMAPICQVVRPASFWKSVA